MRLLQKVADNKPVVTNEIKDEPEITILRKTKVGPHGDIQSGDKELDSKELLQTLVDWVLEEIVMQTSLRKKRGRSKRRLKRSEQIKVPGSGWCIWKKNERKNLSGVSGAADEDSTETEDEPNSLCMILAETKMKNQDRELHMDPSSGTYNLDLWCQWRRRTGYHSGSKETVQAVIMHFERKNESRAREQRGNLEEDSMCQFARWHPQPGRNETANHGTERAYEGEE